MKYLLSVLLLNSCNSKFSASVMGTVPSEYTLINTECVNSVYINYAEEDVAFKFCGPNSTYSFWQRIEEHCTNSKEAGIKHKLWIKCTK